MSEGQAGEVWESSNKAVLFSHGGALEITFILFILWGLKKIYINNSLPVWSSLLIEWYVELQCISIQDFILQKSKIQVSTAHEM